MKIITTDYPGDGHEVRTQTGKLLFPYGKSNINTFWKDEELEALGIEPKEGEQAFNVPFWKVQLLLGQIPARTNTQLKFISQF